MAAILPVTIIWFSTPILLPPFGAGAYELNVRDQRFWFRGNRVGLFGCAEQSKVVRSESPRAT
jgi:hypothetical protein